MCCLLLPSFTDFFVFVVGCILSGVDGSSLIGVFGIKIVGDGGCESSVGVSSAGLSLLMSLFPLFKGCFDVDFVAKYDCS